MDSSSVICHYQTLSTKRNGMVMPSWWLEDADLIAAEQKYTFFKPPRETIAMVKAGEVVKLIFVFESGDPEAPRAERMWVVVESIEADGRFIGRLNNQPSWIKDLKLADQVTFDASNIINTEHDDDDNLIERYIKRCFVTNRILKDGARVAYLYREAPENERDSGWRFTANDESDEYMDDSKNVALVSVINPAAWVNSWMLQGAIASSVSPCWGQRRSRQFGIGCFFGRFGRRGAGG
ncbi:DUF2185 domain-containing protein [Rugamonas sp. FT107W]|uniref:DUF2185 domain-containing protein n=1 Tax=Duganella vulcania TaxID=2692166 RepID=A0A845HJT7_9BURK|nr:DUF2185 domain-containing protein [Duganella vulcania]MYN19031.1 DUF2185 domain-containing protein [Duganella vulcania]